jgi:hypothetical protein
MKNDFFIKLAKKDEKMTLLKIATVLCFIVHTMMLVNSESIHLYTDGYGRVSILHLMDYTMYFLVYFLVYFLLENILIIIYLKFKVNREIDKFFKLNYILLILTMGLYSLSTIFIIFIILSIYKCFEFAKTFSKNKENLILSILSIFIIVFIPSLSHIIDNSFFIILVLLLGTVATLIIYLYSKKINKVPSLNYLFLLLTEICLLIRNLLSFESFNFIKLLIVIITIIVNLRVVFPQIKSYTNFSKIQKIIVIIGILFSLFSKVYIIEKQEQIESILKQESDTNNSNENNTSE